MCPQVLLTLVDHAHRPRARTTRERYDAVFLALPAEAIARIGGAPRGYAHYWDAVTRNRLIRCLARYPPSPAAPTPPSGCNTQLARHTMTHAPEWRQVIYCDHREADHVYNVLRLPDGMELVRARVRHELGDTWSRFGGEDDCFDVHYWKHGTHSWRPALRAKDHYRRILHPDGHLPWFIAGSSFSHFQHWMEGALETAHDAYARWRRFAREWWFAAPDGRVPLSQRRVPLHRACAASARRWTMAEVANHRHVVLDGYVYDVGPIVARHPGGMAVLEGVRGKDISAIYHRIGHSGAARAWVEQHCVGRIDTNPPQ